MHRTYYDKLLSTTVGGKYRDPKNNRDDSFSLPAPREAEM